jgi:arylsulfatase A-like enzyme
MVCTHWSQSAARPTMVRLCLLQRHPQLTASPAATAHAATRSLPCVSTDTPSGFVGAGWAAWLEELGCYKVPKEMFVSPKSDEGKIYMRGAWPGGRQDPPFEDAIADSEETEFIDVHPTDLPGQFSHKRRADNGHAASAFYAAEHSDSAYVVNNCMRHVRARHGAPWACHISFFKPHPPWLNPKPHSEDYHPDCGHVGLDEQCRAQTKEEQCALHPWLDWRLSHPSQAPTVAPESDDDLALLRSQYWASCAEVDAQLGRLFRFIKERGEWDRTLVVFTADHGEELGEHWLVSKTGFFDSSYHLPLIIRDPRPLSDPSRGRVFEALTEAVDLMPTIMEAFGLAVPAQVDGQSLMPFLKEAAVPEYWRSAVHWEFDFRGDAAQMESPLCDNPYDANMAVLRRADYKLVFFAAEGVPMLLFDLSQDERELVNVATQPEYAAVLMECMGEMLRWRARHREHSLSHVSVGAGGAFAKFPTMHEAVSGREDEGARPLPRL